MGSKHTRSTAERQARRLGKSLFNSNKEGQVGVSIRSAKSGGFTGYKNRTALVQTGASGFYDPMDSLVAAIKGAIDEEANIQPVRSVSGIEATLPSQIAGHIKAPHFKCVLRRVDRGFTRMWGRKQGGWFFMYQDKVIFVSCSRSTGWVHQVVPEEGL
jgi:hypothetical protein